MSRKNRTVSTRSPAKGPKTRRNVSKNSTRNRPYKATQPVHRAMTVASCSILDPFCPAARAAKRPDGLGAGTIAFQVRGSLTVTTDASGYALLMVVPGYGRFGYSSGTYAAGWTLPATWSTLGGSAFINTNASAIRIVSMGAIFRSVASMTNCQGLLHRFVLQSPTVSQTFTLLNQNNTEDSIEPMTSGTTSSWVAKPLGADAHRFFDYASVTNTMSDFNWTSCGFEIVGGPASTAVAYVEVVVNVEFQLNSAGITTTGLPGTVAGSKPANRTALAAQQTVQSKISSFISGGVESVEKVVWNAASTAVEDIFGSAATFGLELLGL